MRGSCSPLNISTMRVAPILLLITTAGEESFVTFPIRQEPSPNGCDLKMSRARSASNAAINATNLNLRVNQPHHQVAERRAVALNRALKRQPFALCHNRYAVTAQIAAQQNHVAGTHARRRNGKIVFDHADSGGIDEDSVAFALVHDLSVTGDKLDARLVGCATH